MSLGTRIRQTRTQKGITLQDLSDRSGLSKGFICQLENDKASPSLQALEKLSAGLGVPIAFLFLTAEEKIHVVREGERQQYRVGDGPVIHLLSANRRALKMVIMEIPPGASVGGDSHAHEGEECFFVLEGSARFLQGDESVLAKMGDAIHLNGFIPHRIDNAGSETTKILCVSTGAMEDMLDCTECDEEENASEGLIESLE